MDEIFCVPCEVAFGPKEISPGGVRKLGTFKGYTVDFRLKQFRNINRQPMQFIEFTNPKGKNLLAQMHEAATQ